MNYFTVFKNDKKELSLEYVNDLGEPFILDKIPSEIELPLDKVIEYLDAQKTAEVVLREGYELKIEQKNQSISNAFEFIKVKATDDEKLELIDLYPGYEVGKTYSVNDEFRNGENIFRVLQSHTSQSDWIPSEIPSLYLKILPKGVVGEFVQPTGAHDSYSIGDKVMFEGNMYISLINANTWSPSANPSGWEIIPA